MSSQRKAFLLTVAAAFFWGSSFSTVKLGLEYMDPYFFVFLRFLIASFILLAAGMVFIDRSWIPEVLRDPYVIGLGAINALAFGLQFRGQVETTAASAAMIINSSAVLVAPFAIIFLKEMITKKQLIALPIGMLGVYFIVWSPGPIDSPRYRLTGDLMVSLSAFLYALYIVITRMIMTRRPYSGPVLVTGVFLWSLPVFFLIWALASRSYAVSLEGLALSAYLAIFCSIIPFILWVSALKHITALTSAIALLSELVFGVILALVLLGERLSDKSIIGCVLISGALLMLGHSNSAIQSP